MASEVGREEIGVRSRFLGDSASDLVLPLRRQEVGAAEDVPVWGGCRKGAAVSRTAASLSYEVGVAEEEPVWIGPWKGALRRRIESDTACWRVDAALAAIQLVNAFPYPLRGELGLGSMAGRLPKPLPQLGVIT